MTTLEGSYVSVEDATTYYTGDPRSSTAFISAIAWYLKRATFEIDKISYQGFKYLDTQDRQFPRKFPVDLMAVSPWGKTLAIDTYGYAYQEAVPDQVLTACMEEALALYLFYQDDDAKERDARKVQGVTSHSDPSGSESYIMGDTYDGLKSKDAYDLLSDWIESGGMLT